MKTIIVDISKCSGCYNCQIACKDEHVGQDWLPYAKAQPDTGQFWLKIEEHSRGTVPKVKLHYIPRLCHHCADPECARACKYEAITRRGDGLVLIDPLKCTGCGDCAEACTYTAIYMNAELGIAQKCTGCAHLLDAGEKEPRCVEVCATGALRFIDTPEGGIEYLNIPKQFVAGTVYDPVEKEVRIGLPCKLEGEGGVHTTETDDFGDFWFEGLDEGLWTLTLGEKVLAGIDTSRSVNLGDIPI